MIFEIKVQKRTQFDKNYTYSDSSPTTPVVEKSNFTQSLSYDFSIGSAASLAVSTENGILTGAASKIFGSVIKDAGDALKGGSLFRTTKQITDTIALYMPDTLNFQYNQHYSGLSVTQSLGNFGAVLQAGHSIIDEITNSGKSGGAVKNLSPFAAQALSKKFGGDIAFTALSATTGGVLAQNPQLELIYSAPDFRPLSFQFMFYPRDEKEASEVIDIIELFKYHQAPEILEGSYGRFLVPPSEFNIQFMYNGQPNPNIPKVTTCVLESIDVDYAPNGFAAYETGKNNIPTIGGTGMPVAIRLDLRFKEVEIITKRFFKDPNSRNLDTAQEVNINQPAGGGV
jgi:hypothetical protein